MDESLFSCQACLTVFYKRPEEGYQHLTGSPLIELQLRQKKYRYRASYDAANGTKLYGIRSTNVDLIDYRSIGTVVFAMKRRIE